MHRLQEGLVLGQRYRLGDRLAVGGMGEIWRTDDLVLHRRVAAKILKDRLHHIQSRQAFTQRFASEARYAAALSHPNIATVFDYGEHDDLAFLIMELIEGRSLAEVIEGHAPLDPGLARSVLCQAGLALAAAHEARVIHRDVKPANIMIAPSGQVKLTDFGIAQATDADGFTMTGEVMGTPHYISPEQASGGRATESSDLYALGLVGYEMLTRRRPFERDTAMATLLAHMNEPPAPLPAHLPDDLRGVIMQCLAKDPGARPVSARAIAAFLGVQEVVASQRHAGQLSRVTPTSTLAADSWPTLDPGTPRSETPSTPLVVRLADVTPYLRHWVSPQEQSYDLDDLLAQLEPRLNPGEFAVVSVTEMPHGITPFMTMLEPEGVTMLVTVDQAQRLGLDFELPLSWITLGAYRAIAAQGYVPAVTAALAQARIPSVAGAGRWHTHLFVPSAQSERAMKVLTRLSRAYRDDEATSAPL